MNEALQLMSSARSLPCPSSPLRVGIVGPLGAGKTRLTAWLCDLLSRAYEVAAITNDVRAREDAEFLTGSGALAPERVMDVAAGRGHATVHEEVRCNLAAVAEIVGRFPALEIVLIEGGDDNLAAIFSPELTDLTIYMIEAAAADAMTRSGGPGLARSDLLVINKIDLAPLASVSLAAMDRDARGIRGTRPVVFTSVKRHQGLADIARFILQTGGLPYRMLVRIP